MDMYSRKITKKMYDYLLKHIAEIQKAKDMLIKEYYSDNIVECRNFELFINDYISSVTNAIHESKIVACGENTCPFVIIGSIVQVQDMDYKEVNKYLITPPYSMYTAMDIDQASCLSPLGKALLLKGLNEKVNVQIPTGVLRYEIKSIELPALMEDEESSLQNITEKKGR